MGQIPDILKLSLHEISTKIKNKKISPVELTTITLDAINQHDKYVNSYITLMQDEAIKQSKISEEEIFRNRYRGPLHGIPINLKDLINVKDVKTTLGTKVYQDYLPDEDSHIVKQLENSGSILIGKTNMDQFAFDTTGDTSYYGPTHNPYNFEKIAGGSSSGSAASVAMGFSYGSIGSDTSGSIRVPASCCGVVGMKPTFGMTNNEGIFKITKTLDHIGPLTRTVKDNAILLQAIWDNQTNYFGGNSSEDFTENIGKDISSFTIGIPKSIYQGPMANEVKMVFENNVKELSSLGVAIKYIDLDLEKIYQRQQTIVMIEAYSILKQDINKHSTEINNKILKRISSGRHIALEDYTNALNDKKTITNQINKKFKNIDIIMLPTLYVIPFNINQQSKSKSSTKQDEGILKHLAAPFNLTGYPAISVSGGKSQDGLPIGIQLVGGHFQEAKIYQAAYWIEQCNKS